MEISVTYLGKKQKITLKKSDSVKTILDMLKINPETVLVGKNGEIVPETEPVNKDDTIEIIRVISGG